MDGIVIDSARSARAGRTITPQAARRGGQPAVSDHLGQGAPGRQVPLGEAWLWARSS